MKVLALVTFSSSALSMAQGEIADVAESVANPLIEVGYLEKWVNPVELPSVDAEDNGKVLKVVSGEWAKGSESGGGGGNAEPFFFVVEIKGLDSQSGEPIIEETSTTYNDLMSMVADGRPIYCHIIAPLELASLLNNEVESMLHLIAVNHAYHSETQEHYYLARFDGMMFMATSPSVTLVSEASGGGGGGGGDITPT